MGFEFDKDLRIKLELDTVDASLVVEAINAQLDILLEDPTLKNIAKYSILAQIGKDICNQIIPIDQQWELLQKYKKDQTIIQALKKEKGV